MHPVFFYIGKFPIAGYGAMLALAMIVGVAIAVWRGKKVGVASDQIMDLAFWGIIAGIVGGRITYIFTTGWKEFLESPFSVLFARAGLVFLGGLAGAIAVIVFLVWRRKQNFWLLADVLVPSVAIGHAIGRIGCFLAGCCFGKVCPVDSRFGFLGVRFPATTSLGESQAFSDQLQQHLVSKGDLWTQPVWPTQLLESAGNLVIFGLLMLLWRRRRFNGEVLLAYVTLYSVLRFLLEYLRGDFERGFIGPLSTSQFISVLGLVFVAAAYRRLRRTQDLSRQMVIQQQEKMRKKKRSPERTR